MNRTLRLANYLTRIAAPEDRIRFLSEKYKTVPVQVIQQAAQVDPTSNKMYLEWIVRGIKTGTIRLMEDGGVRRIEDARRVREALTFFNTVKDNKRQREQYHLDRDINKYNLNTLEDIYYKSLGKTNQESQDQPELKGFSVIYDKFPYKIIQIGGNGVDLEEASQAACHFAQDTRWCTKQPGANKNYLKKGPLYIIFENGKKIAQMSPATDQLMDTEDKKTIFKDNHEIYHILLTLGIITSADYIWYLKVDLNLNVTGAEDVFKSNPKYAYLYAIRFLKHRWPEAESTIAKSAKYALQYMSYFKMKGRWREAEPAIYEDDIYFVEYAVLNGIPISQERLESIKKNPEAAIIYAMNFIHDRWIEAEPYILQDMDKAFEYAFEVVQDPPWPALKKRAMEEPYWAAVYATQFERRRLPEMESFIKTDPDAWRFYEETLREYIEV